jgi:HEAT repeat protein
MPAGRCLLALAVVAVVFGCGGGTDARIGEAAGLAERRGDPRAEARLRELLADPEPAVRATALAGLAAVAAGSTDREILAALDDEAPQVRAVAARALGVRAVPGAEAVLAALVRRDPSDDVRLHGVGALSGYPGPTADEALAAAADDPSAAVRLRAIGALSAEALRLVPGILAARALGDVSWEVRAEAVRALARAESPLSWVPVEAARLDGSEFVRAAAFAAEKHLRSRGVPRSLPEESGEAPPAEGAEEVYTPGSVLDAGGPTDGPPDSP